jgi:hypothetical protein
MFSVSVVFGRSHVEWADPLTPVVMFSWLCVVMLDVHSAQGVWYQAIADVSGVNGMMRKEKASDAMDCALQLRNSKVRAIAHLLCSSVKKTRGVALPLEELSRYIYLFPFDYLMAVFSIEAL